jgi:disulfide bond formation protein DsbB
MSLVSSFEHKALFNLTRALALFVVMILLLGLVGGLIMLGHNVMARADTHVALTDITGAEMAAKGVLSDQDAQMAQDTPAVDEWAMIKLPFAVQKYFSELRNKDLLLSRLRPLSAEERDAYLANLAELITAAEQKNFDKLNIYRAINQYMALKEQKLAQRRAFDAKQVSDRLYLGGFIVAVMTLIALFSLILVLLAIERNTRLQPKTV